MWSYIRDATLKLNNGPIEYKLLYVHAYNHPKVKCEDHKSIAPLEAKHFQILEIDICSNQSAQIRNFNASQCVRYVYGFVRVKSSDERQLPAACSL